ncbi:glycoside/pentoside/hexuronide:cation symporter, GPH family [Paenibacillus sp. UNCCL117]|uniref:MFS transporter n=1 Tax=unclassified Paenibacillus TaxID=185978 RepID=UPI0008923C03|nr:MULTISPECIES: MFS transporter [unclassified Paenibacillus]SDD77410.1 glycoside/pentoside/hexuronide:cation symporter, GPH family [Paenibacillus sp. cl123]SFW52718.1 glycoside/pentoside/hexuronide:cation symporter, GPH family [Paenibacillus sp. UNCCL117]
MRQTFVNSPIAYALGMFAMMIPSQAFSAFYSYYYVEKLGLGIGLATLARTVYLIWDAANQPLAGYWSDRTRTRFGRRKPWIWFSIPFFMLTFCMIFSVPQGLSGHGLFLWFLVALVLFEGVATIIWVNYGALFPELFRGERLRAKASAIQQGFQIAAILIGSAVTPLLFAWMGFGYMSLVYAVLFAVCMLLCMASVREDEQIRQEPALPLKEAFRATLQNREFWIFNIANSFAQTVNGLVSSMIPFYAKYVLQIPESQVSILLASVFVSVIPLVTVWYWIVRKLGGVRSWRLSLAAYGLSVIPLWFGSSLASGIAAGILVGFGLAGFLVTPPVLSSRIIDRDYERTGQRREGVYTAVGGFITRSSGLISALAFWIVGMTFGYVSGDNPGPDPAGTFRVLISVVPACLLVISFLLSLTIMRNGESGRGSGSGRHNHLQGGGPVR